MDEDADDRARRDRPSRRWRLGTQIASQFRTLADVLEETAGEVREARIRYDDQATLDVGGVGADSSAVS